VYYSRETVDRELSTYVRLREHNPLSLFSQIS